MSSRWIGFERPSDGPSVPADRLLLGFLWCLWSKVKSRRHVRLCKCMCVWERPRLFNDCSGRAVAVRLHFKDLYSRRSVFASVTEKQEMASHTLQQWQFFTLWFLTCCCITGCLRLAQGRAFVLQMLFVSDSFSPARMPRQEHCHNSWENTQEHKRIHKY